MLGYQTSDVLKKYLQNAKAFVFAAEEDFGIAPLEAQACGTPVIAFAKGGALETLRGLDAELPTAVFFKEQTTESIIEAVHTFEKIKISATACRDNAKRFANERFRQEFSAFVNKQFDIFTIGQAPR
jgi:glycosyltransferase involved in cell wall biosynthesis